MGGRFPFPAVPDGWFAVIASEDLASGQVTALSCLERELVVFRDADGTPRVFDAHCPHLGAHLGFGGQVCDDGIVCPFHGWRFDGDGQLVEVPRLERAPRAAAHAWEVRERNGRIFVWHHAHGEAPEYEILTYRADGSEWTPWRTRSYQVRTHVQELTENIIDRSHFYQVHDMVPPDDDRFDVAFNEHSMTVDQSIKVTAVADTGFEVQTRTTTCGPGIVAVEVREGPLDMLTFITQTPLMDELVEVTISFSMKALDDELATESVSSLNAEVTNLQFTQDIPIFEHKIYRDRPMLTKVDGPVARYRRWFRRFYSGWDPEPSTDDAL
ncbi:MAG TPA: Rieske 2Fe-2S domain-containing protein [Acidimicrobiales bacterium]|nr:Rieske 2Fe-2S domain-containing protein [Acidimicrobiales bacterium]